MNPNLQQFGALTGAPDWMNYTLPIPDLGPVEPMKPMAPLTGTGALGSDGGKGGNKGGPDLARGEADIGYGKAGATADTTTTATNDWSDFLSSLAVGLFGGPISQASYAMFGKTPVSALKDYTFSQLFGPSDLSGSIGQNPAGLSNPGVDRVGQANDPFGGATGLGQGSDPGFGGPSAQGGAETGDTGRGDGPSGW